MIPKPKAYFYILWNPASFKPPTVRFPTRKAALAVAERMACTFGESFYVLRAVSISNRGAAVTTVLR